MRRHSIIIFLIILFSGLSIQVSYPALKDFKQDYEKDESSKSSGSGSSSSSSSSDDCIGSCLGDLLWDVCLGYLLSTWIDVNRALDYDQYPYHSDEKPNFVCSYLLESESAAMLEKIEKKESDPDNSEVCFDGKSWFLTLEAGGQYAYDNGNGGFARLSGKVFKMIGPEIEVKRIVDEYDDHLDFYAMGVNIPIVQFSGFMPDFYIQAAFLRGIIERDGIGYGIIINSYPFKPFSLMARFGVQSYDNIKGQDYGKMEFYDYEGRVGVILNRFEFFAGYRKIKAETAELEGPIAGVKIFF